MTKNDSDRRSKATRGGSSKRPRADAPSHVPHDDAAEKEAAEKMLLRTTPDGDNGDDRDRDRAPSDDQHDPGALAEADERMLLRRRADGPARHQ
jgi:hypothetical protein